MGLFKRKTRSPEYEEPKPVIMEDEQFLDLGEIFSGDEGQDMPPATYIRIGELSRPEHLAFFTKLIYENNILILDIAPLESDKKSKEVVIGELKKIVADIDGDLVAISKTFVVVTPTGTKVDRRKLKVGK